MDKVIYDNSCQFCITIKSVLEKLDFFNQFHWIGSNNVLLELDKYNLNKELLDTTIIVIKNNEITLLEFEACRYILSRTPVFLPFLFLFYVPFVSKFLGNKLYRKISRNRKCNVQ